jgi:hypothetical protein
MKRGEHAMFNSKRSYPKSRFDRKFQIFDVVFGVMFVLVAAFIVTVFYFVISNLIAFHNDPASLGRLAGEVIKGFNEVK